MPDRRFKGVTVLAGCLLVALVIPVNVGIARLFITLAIPTLWFLVVRLLWRRRLLACALLLAGALAGLFLVLPGRPIDPTRLRSAYLLALRRYEGTRYIWGGENGRGIDCSGLVRRGLVDAYTRLGVTTLNPRAFRAAFQLWWYDCSAEALGTSHRGFTTRLCSVASANAAAAEPVLPGDLGVTANGVHVLAYLGSGEWIQAEPGLRRVVSLRAPHANIWMNRPLIIVRWTALAGP